MIRSITVLRREAPALRLGAALRTLAVGLAARRLALLVTLALVLLLTLHHQPYYPATWFDEGLVLQGAINLVRFGQYAMRSAEGFRVLDQPLIANGPGIVLPISGAFALLGIGLFQARLIVAVYTVLAAAAFFAVAKRTFGPAAAWTALALLLAIPQEGFLFFGRQVLGNVPALFYFLAGYLLWLKALARGGIPQAVGAGLLFGLAVITKNQYGLLLFALLVTWLTDRLSHRQMKTKTIVTVFATATACLVAWYGLQLALVGWEHFGSHLRAVTSSSRVTVFAFRPMRLRGSLWYLLRSGLPLFGIPGLAWGLWACKRRGPDSQRQWLLLVFALVWLAWYLLASVGWHRYAFEFYAVSALLTGKFVVDAVSFLRTSASRLTGRSQTFLRRVTLLLIGAIIAGSALGLTLHVRDIAAAPDTAAHEFARRLQAHVAADAVVESWEWQLDVLAPLTYHHPTNDWVDKMTAALQFGDKLEEAYDLSAHQPDYLIDGPFSKWTGLYARPLADGCCTLVLSVGPYDLYQVGVPGGTETTLGGKDGR